MKDLSTKLTALKAAERKQMTQVTNPNSGFQSLLKQRAAMQNWSHLANLLNLGRNREAAAIVDSFQLQMDREESEKLFLAA